MKKTRPQPYTLQKIRPHPHILQKTTKGLLCIIDLKDELAELEIVLLPRLELPPGLRQGRVELNVLDLHVDPVVGLSTGNLPRLDEGPPHCCGASGEKYRTDFFFSLLEGDYEERWENEEPEMPIYRHRLSQQSRRIRMNGKSKARNKLRNRRWVFKRTTKMGCNYGKA